MAVETTYTKLRDELASYLDRVVQDREVVIVHRRGSEDVALIPAGELAGLTETAHLLRSPNNAKRLMSALKRAQRGAGKPEPVSKLRREMGIE
jgi:antitoxin YefM